jgi:very-short-patch-repair endonuclease
VGGETRLTDEFSRPTLAAIGASMHAVVSTQELLAAGLSQDQIRHLVTIGFLHRLHRGVYAIGRAHVAFEGMCRAAWLACGPGSAVSHITAARDWSIRRSTGAIHISVPRGRTPHPGLHVHRPRSLPLADIVERDGYAVTSVARTLLDMSVGESVDRVAKWIHEAGVMRVLDFHEVHAVLGREQHHRGRAVLEAALAAEVAPTRSELEEAFLAISRRARMPKPMVNEHVWSGVALEEVDVHWPQLGLICEVDGGAVHWSRWRRRRDAAKDARFRAQGWIVWRVPELDITLAPDTVASQLRRLATVGLENPADSRISPPTP